MNKRIPIVLIVLPIVAILFNEVPAFALKSIEKNCNDLEVVFARGSGSGNAVDIENSTFNNELKEQLQSRAGISLNQYDLGSEPYDNAQYPHVDISLGVGAGAFFSGGEYFKYGRSVNEGIRELKGYLEERIKQCPDSAYIIAGYSQGAQVIGDTLPDLPIDTRDKIDYVALFADPKLNIPEAQQYTVWKNFIDSGGYPYGSEGGLEFKVPDSCYGVSLSSWHHTIDNCEYTRSGLLGARDPYIPTDMSGRVNLWCIDKDIICGSVSPDTFDDSGHETHYIEDRAIPTAVKEALSVIADRRPNLRPEIVVDTDIKKHTLIENARYDVAILQNDFCIVGDLPGDIEIRKKIYSDGQLAGNINFGEGLFPGFIQEEYDYSPMAATKYILPNFPFTDWRSDAQKIIYVYSEPWCRIRSDNPDKLVVYESTSKSVARTQSLRSISRLGAVDSNPPIIVLLATPDSYEYFVNLTQGYENYYVIPYSETDMNIDDIPTSRNILLRDIYSPRFTTNEYKASVGQPIVFTLDTLTTPAAITQYKWDFNDDGIIDEHTTEPRSTHLFDSSYKGLVRVEVTDSDGASGKTSTNVSTLSPLDATSKSETINIPSNIHITKISSTSVKIEWTGDDARIDYWMIRLGGFPIGKAERLSRSVTVTDLVFTDPLTFSVSGLENGREGDSSSATIEPQADHETPSLSRTGEDVAKLITTQDQELRTKEATSKIQPNSTQNNTPPLEQDQEALGSHTLNPKQTNSRDSQNTFIPITLSAILALSIGILSAALYARRKSPR